MIKSSFINIITSIPVILLALFFLPVLGILLIVLRLIAASTRTNSLSILLIITGLLIQVPNLLNKFSDISKSKIPYLDKIIDHDIYLKLTKYSVFIIIVGIVLLIVSTVTSKLFSGIKSAVADTVSDYVNKQVEQDREIDKENDLEMKMKQEKAKNFHVVHCPHCGADNIVYEKVTKCKYCRKELEIKE